LKDTISERDVHAAARKQLETEKIERRELSEPELDRRQNEIDRLEASLAKVTSINNELKSSLAAAVSERDAEAAARNQLEPEIALLRSHIEHSKFEKETQLLRRRLMNYADSHRRMSDELTELRGKFTEAQRLCEMRDGPELARLQADFAAMWKTKTEWFEPQLDHRAARIAQLEMEVERLNQQAQNVLPVRMMRATIKEMRRIAGAVRRRLKR
jgi:chromosome segregation ATPase